MSKRFMFSINVEHVLTIDEIWPDGDAPENPTEEDVRRQFYRDGGSNERSARDWNLLDGMEVNITEMKQ